MVELSVVFSPDEAAALRRLADAEGCDPAEAVRAVVVRELAARARDFEEVATHVLAVSTELNRRLA